MPKVLDLPEVFVGRCKFPRPMRNITTFNVGDLIPLCVECNVTPGDVAKIPIKALIRMQTPLYPVADDLTFDVTAWFVPDRLTWKHFKNFWGENDVTFWEQPTKYEIPQIEAPSGGWGEGSLADYFGIPTKVSGISVSHMPFRAYSLVWNSFFRDENLKEPIFINDDETTLTGKNVDANYDYTTYTQLGAAPAKVAKRSDYFTKALPEPQKADDIFIPIGESAPIIGVEPETLRTGFTTETGMLDKPIGLASHQSSGDNTTQVVDTSSTTNRLDFTSKEIGLAADLTNALGVSVLQLRQCVALQRFAELQARSGSRYIETLASVFGVKSSDARLQRPEYIGGKSFPISMAQVVANTAASGQAMGNVGGMSQTIINDYIGTKGFEEHGTLLILGCVRVRTHTYQQGLHRMFTRKALTDFYNRAYDHIGEFKVRNDEIFAQGSSVTDPNTGKPMDELPFGYQPAYEDMRLGRSIVTGEMRSNATASLDAWHYADDYEKLPTLSSDWIDEDKTNVDRTLTIKSNVSNQLFGDFLFEMEWTRGMSMYGTPGFMDHM